MITHETCVPILELRRLADFHDEQHPVHVPCCSICVERNDYLTAKNNDETDGAA